APPMTTLFPYTTLFRSTSSKIVDDIKTILKAAKSKGITHRVIMMDDVTASYIADNEQVKNNFAFSGGIATVGANVPSLDDEQLVSFFRKKFSLSLKIVDRTITIEKNGKRSIKTPWAEGAVVFFPSEKV